MSIHTEEPGYIYYHLSDRGPVTKEVMKTWMETWVEEGIWERVGQDTYRRKKNPAEIDWRFDPTNIHSREPGYSYYYRSFTNVTEKVAKSYVEAGIWEHVGQDIYRSKNPPEYIEWQRKCAEERRERKIADCRRQLAEKRIGERALAALQVYCECFLPEAPQ